MEAKEVLGLDVGVKTTGIARASNVARLAEPLDSVLTSETIKTLKKYLSDNQVEAVVVGLPRSLSGEDTDQTRWVRQWADKAKQRISIPLYWQDEALTSKVASSNQQVANGKADEHSLAAAIILQDFLDSPETSRMVI